MREESVLTVQKQQWVTRSTLPGKTNCCHLYFWDPKMLESSFYYHLVNHIITFLLHQLSSRGLFYHYISKINHSAGNIMVISKRLWANDWINHNNPGMHALIQKLILLLFSWMMEYRKKKCELGLQEILCAYNFIRMQKEWIKVQNRGISVHYILLRDTSKKSLILISKPRSPAF